ncbi:MULTISPECIES: hypothetical protein [unclassified Mycobacterium]|nr:MULTISPECIES: hypothetical protein [unclassified Mycobacterium]
MPTVFLPDKTFLINFVRRMDLLAELLNAVAELVSVLDAAQPSVR